MQRPDKGNEKEESWSSDSSCPAMRQCSADTEQFSDYCGSFVFVSFMRNFRLFSALAGRRLRLALEAISRAPTARGQ
jgi:hypothetical protein